MNVLIEVSYNMSITVPHEHSAALLALIPHVRVVEKRGYGDSEIHKVAELPPKVEFIDSAKLAPVSDAETALKKLLCDKNNDWEAAYNKNAANENRIADLEREISSLRGAA